MHSKQYVVTLLEDVVLSQTAATAGGHAGLDYLPGSVFLGAVASSFYTDLSKKDAYKIFHSGMVRFGNALPLSADGDIGYPVPRCWFHEKREDGLTSHAENYLRTDFPKDRQLKQYRDKYVPLRRHKNELFSITPHFRMKTAINPKTAMAAENQLFGYSNLPAGAKFHFQLSADDEISSAHFNKIGEILLSGNLHIGRSRSAEYGSIQIDEVEQVESFTIHMEEKKSVTFWLLADCAFQDKNGLPTLQPEPQLIGLSKEWKLDLTKSFLHSRRYAPYNAHYQRRELEREVLGMGSVLYYRKNDEAEDINHDFLKKIQEGGIGLYRQSGLGRVWINPPVLSGAKPKFENKPTVKVEQYKIPPEPAEDVLYRYLLFHENSKMREEKIIQAAKMLKDELINKYKSAWNLEPYTAGGCLGPSATQWGRVMEAAKSAMEDPKKSHLQDALFVPPSCICKKEKGQWDDQWDAKVIDVQGDSVKQTTFGEWFLSQFDQLKDNPNCEKIVALFARFAMDVARKQSCFLPREEKS